MPADFGSLEFRIETQVEEWVMGGSWEHAVGKARDRALGWVEKEPTQENEDGAPGRWWEILGSVEEASGQDATGLWNPLLQQQVVSLCLQLHRSHFPNLGFLRRSQKCGGAYMAEAIKDE